MPIFMTAQWVERLKPPTEDRKEYFDENVPGLVLRVTKAKKKFWFLQYRVKGDPKKRRMSLGSYPAVPLTDARDAAREALLKAARGQDPAAPQEAPADTGDSMAFRRLTELYIERYARVHKKTWELDEARIKRNWLDVLGDRPAAEINRQDIREVYEGIASRVQRLAKDRQKGQSGAEDQAPRVKNGDGGGKRGLIEANRNLQLVRAIYNWAIDEEMLDQNPAQRVKTVKEDSRERVLTVSEIRAIWHATYKLSGKMGTIYRLKLILAQRSAEVEAMRWRDLDGHWWNIPGPLTKPGRPHRVYLPDSAIRELSAIERGVDWVFGSDAESGHVDNVGKALQRLKKLTGIGDFTGHDFRRTAATMMARLKVPRGVTSRVLNHAGRGDDSPGVTAVYTRYAYDDEKRDALERWAGLLAGIVEGHIKSDDQIGASQDTSREPSGSQPSAFEVPSLAATT